MSAAIDDFAKFSGPLGAPDCYGNHAAVTTSDTNDLTHVSRAIYVGGTGDVVATVNGADATYKAVPVGTVLRIRASRIKATGTTATLMIALW